MSTNHTQLSHSKMNSGLYQDLLICVACGRDFAHLNAYSNHVRSCRLQKKRAATALDTARETYKNKKIRLTINEVQVPATGEPIQQHSTLVAETVLNVSGFHLLSSGLVYLIIQLQISKNVIAVNTADTPSVPSESDDSRPLAQRRSRRENRQLPRRYRDEQPAALASLPPVVNETPIQTLRNASSPTPATNSTMTSPLITNLGSFGYTFRRHSLPTTLMQKSRFKQCLRSLNLMKLAVFSASLFAPYPNQSVFLLGELVLE